MCHTPRYVDDKAVVEVLGHSGPSMSSIQMRVADNDNIADSVPNDYAVVVCELE